jgi:predicted ester cyclase
MVPDFETGRPRRIAYATLEDILAEGDRVAYRLTLGATHRNTLQGIASTDKSGLASPTAIVRIVDGHAHGSAAATMTTPTVS